MTKGFITPSLISTQALCEWMIYLEKVEGQKRIRTKPMIDGAATHSKLEEDHKQKAEHVSVEKFIHEGGITREFFLMSQKYGLWGRIDELVITPEHAVIIDDKKNAKAYPSYINQLTAYAFLVEEELLPNKPIYMAIRDSESKDIIWMAKYEKEHRERLISLVERVKNILSKKEEPNPTKNPKICSFCSFQCPKRLAPYVDGGEQQRASELSQRLRSNPKA